MLARHHRLPLRGLPYFFKQAKCLNFPTYRLFITHNEVGFCRVAVSISKNKISAVDRNHYKRKIFQVVERFISYLPSDDIVIYAKKNTFPSTTLTADLEQTMRSVFRQLDKVL